MLWSYALNLTYKRCVPVWLLQLVVFCVINWKFCFCFRHFNLDFPMSIGNWADHTDIFQACVHFLPLDLACPSTSFFDLLLFSVTSPEILFPDIFSFYRQSNLSHDPLYSLTFNICVQISHFQSCSEGNSSRGSVVWRPSSQHREKEPGAPFQLTYPASNLQKMILYFACLSWGSFF